MRFPRSRGWGLEPRVRTAAAKEVVRRGDRGEGRSDVPPATELPALVTGFRVRLGENVVLLPLLYVLYFKIVVVVEEAAYCGKA
jgi:hypothetical protein